MSFVIFVKPLRPKGTRIDRGRFYPFSAVPAAVIDRGYKMAAPYLPSKQKAKSYWISLCLAGMETIRSPWLVSNDMSAPQT